MPTKSKDKTRWSDEELLTLTSLMDRRPQLTVQQMADMLNRPYGGTAFQVQKIRKAAQASCANPFVTTGQPVIPRKNWFQRFFGL